MKTEIKNIECLTITDVRSLDLINVYFKNNDLGQGSITITCYGKAWTSYFGSMGDRTIEQFVKSCGADYLVSKMIDYSKRVPKKDEEYFTRIVNAVKESLELTTHNH